MINPISYSTNVNYYTKKPTFRGFYDPTCVSVTQDMKDAMAKAAKGAKKHIKKVVEEAPEQLKLDNAEVKASIDAFKANYMPDLAQKTAENAKAIKDSGSVLVHILPDGISTYEMPVDTVVEKTTILDGANMLVPRSASEVLESAKEASFTGDGSVLKHILPDGVTTVDIPTDIVADGIKAIDGANILVPHVLDALDSGSDVVQGAAEALGDSDVVTGVAEKAAEKLSDLLDLIF